MRSWLSGCLIGAALICYGAMISAAPQAQERIEPALEGQPVPEPRQDASTEQLQDHAAQEEADADRITSLLNNMVQAATRELISNENAQQRERQEHREIADLQAQQDMALWAKCMFWAAVGSVILTFVGVLLIWRTLRYTRTAAVAAVAAVDEAKETVAITRDLGIRQIRAYISLSSAVISGFEVKKEPVVTITVSNSGQSPAIDLRMGTRVNMSTPDKALYIKFDAPGEYEPSTTALHAGPPLESTTPLGIVLDEEIITEVQKGVRMVVVACYISYRDVFRKKRRTVAKLVLDVDSLRQGKGSFRPWRKGNRST